MELEQRVFAGVSLVPIEKKMDENWWLGGFMELARQVFGVGKVSKVPKQGVNLEKAD